MLWRARCIHHSSRLFFLTLITCACHTLCACSAKGGAADEVGFDSPLDAKAEPTIGMSFIVLIAIIRVVKTV